MMTEDEVRAIFEQLVPDHGFKHKRSRKGVYTNPQRARDWRMFYAGYRLQFAIDVVEEEDRVEALKHPHFY